MARPIRFPVLVLTFLFAAIVSGPAFGNRLAGESSPYLRSHTADAVEWRPWGGEALAEARKHGKPILLSIGYAACHWCHVMQRESFTDAAAARAVNRQFVPILVDREARPDIDAVYQAAAAAMDAHTGWPLTLFLTPQGEAYLGGVYFPPEPAPGLPSFMQMAERAAAEFRADPAAVAGRAAALTKALEDEFAAAPGTLSMDTVTAAATALLSRIDPFEGGFDHAPRHPRVPALALLWRAFLRTGNADFAEAVTGTLHRMTAGGLYDHVGGGFFRYTVDERWRQPHFEKMLDVNATLLALMTEVWKETRSPDLAHRVRLTVAFLLGGMRRADGAFAASLDADSRGADGHRTEGAFYLWSEDDIRCALGSAAGPFLAAFDIVPLPEDPDGPGVPLLKEGARTPDGALAALDRQRRRRTPPARNDTILADWNGLAAAALAEAGFTFGEPAWIAAAERTMEAVAATLTDDAGNLRHSRADDRLGPPATLEDYAFLAAAALVLAETAGGEHWIDLAETWADAAVETLWDDAGEGFHFAVADGTGPPVRAKPFLDGPAPSGNAAMAHVLARLYHLKGDHARHRMAERTLAALAGKAIASEPRRAGILNAVEALHAALQVVVIGDRGDAGTRMLLRRIAGTALTVRVLQVVAPGTALPKTHPAAWKDQVDGRATAYVCRGTLCSLPATDAATLGDTLAAMRRSP